MLALRNCKELINAHLGEFNKINDFDEYAKVAEKFCKKVLPSRGNNKKGMKRSYKNNGQNIVTEVKNFIDGKKYTISTAKDPRGWWQVAVFSSIFGLFNPYKPLRVGMEGAPKTFKRS